MSDLATLAKRRADDARQQPRPVILDAYDRHRLSNLVHAEVVRLENHARESWLASRRNALNREADRWRRIFDKLVD